MKNKVYKLTITALFSALLCIGCPFVLPLAPIAITLSVFFILLTGAVLPPLHSCCAVLVYIAIGAVGVPVFSGFRGGFSVLVGVTGGYIAAYPFMALVIAVIVKVFKKRSVLSLSLGMLSALIICYLLGTAWYSLSANVSFSKGLAVCVYPFIPLDLLKAICAICVVKALPRKILEAV